MHIISVQKILLNSSSLKVGAVIIGFLSWTIASEFRYYYMAIDAPVVFYNTRLNQKMSAPETVAITLAARRVDMRHMQNEVVAVHIDARKLREGANRVDLSQKNLLLPRTINLVNYKPIQVSLTNLE
jgi:hypothetical protein